MAEFRVPATDDNSVILTNDEASCSKKFAVSLGYWKDPYIKCMCKQSQIRKTPEISRGYFGRVFVIRSLVEQFVKAHSRNCQIVSVGAGYDTLYWNLSASGLSPQKYVEVDFPSVTRIKTTIIHSKEEQLLKALGNADLRNLQHLDTQLKLPSVGLDLNVPTLFLAECVLMYMPEKECDGLLSYFSQTFTNSHFISYDVINMSDRFAEVMKSNMGSRRCTLYTDDCSTAQAQRDRFSRNGWATSVVENMESLYQLIDSSERSRVEKIEMLDEVHLLSELMVHYCICLATNTDNLLLSFHNLTTTIGS
ncbi:hypothetical protein EB796_021319 [Bugula neritina]|uniref:Leucine carboxyl methyltransferase 1 n=1 Tax=Bugula neritina TaxID=10212 RepID=A0A7J7J3D2_BUGNE|nr:hypothetical protein EB796_021319 [Bugula neritina]